MDPFAPRPARWPALVLVAALLGFALLLADLLAHGPVTHADPAVSSWLARHRTDALTELLFAITQLHATAGIDAMLALGVVVLGLQRRWRTALLLVLRVQGAMGLNVLLKDAFARARPDSATALVHLLSYSFPSGHAVASTVWWGCVAGLVASSGGTARQAGAVASLAAVMVVLACLSRVYLGAHYLSDVLAGVCEGLAWLAAWVLLTRRLRERAG